jgi:histidinol-phosphate aminotransferase
MSRYLDERFSALLPYVPGEQPRDRKYLKLNTNESPSPPSPRALRAAAEAARTLQLYSDPQCTLLREKLAALYGLRPENVICSNGSDEILDFAFATFCGPSRPAVFPDITYGFYRVFAKKYGVPFREIPLRDDLSVDPADYETNGATVFLANPNAPTGLALGREAIERILRANPDRVVVIDEAYADFSGGSAAPLIAGYENLLVTGTFSKSRSMAGARLGFAFGPPEIIADLEKLKYSFNPYNVNRLTQLCGAAALKDGGYYRDCCAKIIREREYLSGELKALGGETTPSEANFVFVRFPGCDGAALCAELKARGVLVRHFNIPAIKDYLRITVGSRDECETLVARLKEIGGAK